MCGHHARSGACVYGEREHEKKGRRSIETVSQSVHWLIGTLRQNIEFVIFYLVGIWAPSHFCFVLWPDIMQRFRRSMDRCPFHLQPNSIVAQRLVINLPVDVELLLLPLIAFSSSVGVCFSMKHQHEHTMEQKKYQRTTQCNEAYFFSSSSFNKRSAKTSFLSLDKTKMKNPYDSEAIPLLFLLKVATYYSVVWKSLDRHQSQTK